jgi:F5/8 type C domain
MRCSFQLSLQPQRLLLVCPVMKRVVLILVLFSVPAWPISRVQHANNSSTTTSVTVTITSSTAGDLLVVAAACGGGSGTLSFSDNKSQTYSKVFSDTTLSSGGVGNVAYIANTASGVTSVTASITSCSFFDAAVVEYSGMQTSSVLDQSVHANGISTSPDSGFFSSAITNNDLIFGYIVDQNTGTGFTAGNDGRGDTMTSLDIGSTVGSMDEDFFPVSTLQTYKCTATVSSSSRWDHWCVAFKGSFHNPENIFPPASYLGYAATAWVNTPLPPNPPVASNSAALVSAFLAHGPMQDHGVAPLGVTFNDFDHPIYWSRASDPVYTIAGCGFSGALNGVTFHALPGMQPGGGSDAHVTVIDQSSGEEYDFWQTVINDTARTIAGRACGRLSISGDALVHQFADGNGANAAITGLYSGQIRGQELYAGVINHAIAVVASCTNGTFVFPAAGRGRGDCPNDPADGQFFQLTYSDAEIDALPVPEWKKTVLHAMHQYGFYIDDTGSYTHAFWAHFESGKAYHAYGYEDPFVSYAQTHLGQDITLLNGVYYYNFSNGVDWTRIQVIDPSVTNFTSVISHKNWLVVFADSQETSCFNGAASNAIDGNNHTFWQTQFCAASPAVPHEIQINLGGTYTMTAFQYLPRQDGNACGWIKDYEFYVSADGLNWGTPVASGTFDYSGYAAICPGPGAGGPPAFQVAFPAKSGKYIRLRALSEINGNPWTTVAEINVLSAYAPAALTSVSLNPNLAIGGTTPTGTVTLTPAPTGGAVVRLSSSNPALASVPAAVTVPPGASSATFTISTSPVAELMQVDISATYNGSAQATLTLHPGFPVPRTSWSVSYSDSQQIVPAQITVVSNVPEDPFYSIARGYRASNLIDGNPATLAYPASRHLDYQISFGQLTQLSSTVINWGMYGSNPIYVNSWSLLGRSAAGQPWLTLAQGGFPNGPTTALVNLGSFVTDLRLVADSEHNWIGVYELAINGSSVVYDDILHTGWGQFSVISNVPEHPVYSIARGYQASNLIDGNLATLAYPASRHLDYQISLGQLTELSSAVITWGMYGANPIYVSSWSLLARSAPGQPWVTLAQGGFPNGPTTLVTLSSFAIDIRLIAESYNNWIGVYELAINGIPSGCVNGAAANAIDGKPSALWTTQYCGGTAAMPHEIQINLGASYSLTAFQYLPRQDGSACGWIKGYEFYVSPDGLNWGTPVASGSFDYTGYAAICPGPGAGVPPPFQIVFPPTSGQYIRLRALSEINGNPWTTVAEINVFGQ